MRKIAIFLLITCMAFVLPVCAASAAQLDVSIPAPDKDAEEYSVTVTLAQNPGIVSLQLELFYDDSVVECTRVVAGEALKGMLTDTNPKAEGKKTSAIISAAAMEQTQKTGRAVTFVFTLPDKSPGFDLVVCELRAEGGADVEYKLNIVNAFDDGQDEQEDKKEENKKPSRPSNTSSGSLIHPAEKPEQVPKGFTDTVGHWAQEYIEKAAEAGIVSGYDDGSFLPDKQMTRAEFATILWNMAEKPVPSVQSPFDDVTGADWFYFPVCWAYEMGYIKGVTETEFSPHLLITREQAMTVLYRYAGSPDTSQTLDGFEDKNTVSDYAVNALCWATQNKIIQGTAPGYISPKSSATRAQLATVVVRMR